MRKSRFNEQQIIAILKEHEVGTPTAEVCRRHSPELVGDHRRPKLAHFDVSRRCSKSAAFWSIVSTFVKAGAIIPH